MPAKTKKATLTIVVASEPPSEFRIFRKGVNKTTKGDFLFDEQAARDVMAMYRKHAVDVMIDLEHMSLDSESNNYDPKAYGWCKLEIRKGELWAVNVSWTKAGAERLRNRESRYVSPAFHYTEDTGRVSEIYNIAICAVPATYETPALVAASKRAGKKIGTLTIEVDNMDVKKILEALGLGEDATLEDVLNAIKALQEGGEEEENATEDDDKDEETSDDSEDEDDDDETATTAAAIKDLDPKLQAQILSSLTSTKVLKERLAKLEKQTETKERDALIAANASKLPKSLEGWARKQSVETLTEFFKGASEVAKQPKKEPKRNGGDSSGTDDAEVEDIKLTPADLKLCKLTGRKPEDFLKIKKAIALRDKQNREVEAAE